MTLVAICLVIPKRMRLSSNVMEIWPFEVLPGRLFQEQSSVGRRGVKTGLLYFMRKCIEPDI